MRVVSMVPSWTETLVEAGVEVVGRTRHCIHPAGRVESIPVVGGTKDWDWKRITDLRPDYLVLDQEENPRFMAEQSNIPFVATHVQAISDVGLSLRQLGNALGNAVLTGYAEKWEAVASQPYGRDWRSLVEWGRRPSGEIHRFVYVIWRNPWMAVSRETYPGSLLAHCGMPPQFFPEKYPELDLDDYTDREGTLLLFASEPYPFRQRTTGLAELGFPYGFVDGEAFNWFGVRGLRFLESARG